jgi:hypothetical protein
MSAVTPGHAVCEEDPEDSSLKFELAMDEAHAIADLLFEVTHEPRMAGESASNLDTKTLNVAAFAITRRIDEARAAAEQLMNSPDERQAADLS